MKLHKILPIIFFMIAMMISCSQETVINENISGEATTPDTKICVNIKTENSRTVRPEITKWEITVTNKSDANLEFSRTIDGKATSATFVNVTDGEYTITVRGIPEGGKPVILLGNNGSFEVKPNTVNVCEIIPEDYFDYYDDNGNPRIGNLNIQISGLKDLFTEGETLLLTCTKLPETNNESDTTCDLIFSEEGKISGEITEIPVGSYKIEISNSKNLNLVKDPVVNIYDNTTTEINWEWNYDSDEINTDQKLKGIKIPVWNKPVSNRDSPAESSASAKNGYLSANALFAEPTWDNDKSYNFTYTDEDTNEEGETTITEYTSEIPASEFDFINCAYDNAGALWVLSGTSNSKYFSGEDGSGNEYRYCYVLKNVSSSENEEYRFTCSEKISKDFAVATVGEQKYLFYITSDGYNIKSFKFRDEDNWNIYDGTPYYDGNQYITAIYAKDNNLYIAVTTNTTGETSNYTTAKIYTGTISTDDTTGTPTLELNKNGEGDAESLLSLDIYSFISDEKIVAQLKGNQTSFPNYNAFMISDMYINEDKSKLYVTAGCVNYDGNSWNNNQDYRVYHSFGGLFVYELEESGNLKKDDDGSITVESYGINNNEITTIDPETENDIDPNPFLTTGGNGVFELESNIMQAENEKSPYFAGPRYIIPSGNDLLIVDSGFYGVYTTPNDYPPLTNCEKRNRIFTFNTGTKGLSLTKVDDSISFDYDYLTSSL